MNREKAIQILKRCEAESYCSHYKRHRCCIGCGQREALDLAIEALKGNLHCPKCGTIVRDGRQYHDLVYRGEAEKLQLSGETSTISEETSTCKLKKDHDSLLKPDSGECKEQKSKLDCISREQFREQMFHRCFEVDNDPNMQKWERGNWIRWKLFEEELDNAPSVTPTERTGEWIENDDFTCSECGYHMIVGGGAYNFCPNCGCKMGGDTE